jgi:hypothetical protein
MKTSNEITTNGATVHPEARVLLCGVTEDRIQARREINNVLERMFYGVCQHCDMPLNPGDKALYGDCCEECNYAMRPYCGSPF